MTKINVRRKKPEVLCCSFCGKSQHEVNTLIAETGVYICDECIELCMRIVAEAHELDGGVLIAELQERFADKKPATPEDHAQTFAEALHIALGKAAFAKSQRAEAAAIGFESQLSALELEISGFEAKKAREFAPLEARREDLLKKLGRQITPIK